MTQEFHISVTPVGNDEYLVRTERVAPGVPLAEEQVIWPVEDWLAHARQLMNDPLLGLLQGEATNATTSLDLSRTSASAAKPDTTPPLSLIELGQHLYSALFNGTLRDSWVTAQGIAQHRREALRLRLGLKGVRLPRLPWEVLYGTDIPIERIRQGLGPAPRPLTAGTHVIFSRYQPGTRLLEDIVFSAVEADQPLRVLMVIAAPTDRERLELYREATQLKQELSTQTVALEGQAGTLPDIQLTILNQPGREQLTQALEQGQYQVLHYAGHSDLGVAGGSLYLVNNRTGLTEILSGDDLAGLLVNNGIRLTVFNSCRGSYTAAADPLNEQERNLAEVLVSRGIPAVLAMAEQIPDNVALTLTWLFYRNLKQGYPIDLSLSRARQGLVSAYGSHQLYWALPVLYLHPEFDGYVIVGDRTQDNPADRLVLTPQGYGALPVLSVDEAPLPTALILQDYAPKTTDEELVAHAVLADETSGWTEELEYSEDQSYDEDAFVVADLIRQLAPSADAGSTTSDWVEQKTGLPAFSREEHSKKASTTNGSAIVPLNEEQEAAWANPEETAAQTLAQSSRNISDNSGSDSLENNHPYQSASSFSSPVGKAGKVRLQRRWQNAIQLFLLGAGGTAAIAFIVFLLLPYLRPYLASFNLSPDSNRSPEQTTAGNSVSSPSPEPNLFGADMVTLPTDQVQAIALDSFSKRRFAQGQDALVILLDRRAINEAEVVLKAVPADRLNTPAFSFLQGRLAWQAIKLGNNNYSLKDVLQAWEKANQEDPETPQYLEALGFAYYADGQSSSAIQTWGKALSLLENPQSDSQEAANVSGIDHATSAQETLMTYAGIALALRKAATDQPPELQSNFSSKAVKIYQMVLTSDPNHFKAEELSQNWLWNEATIQDWQALSQVKP